MGLKSYDFQDFNIPLLKPRAILSVQQTLKAGVAESPLFVGLKSIINELLMETWKHIQNHN
jgi:hypothetical protein